MRIKVIKVVNGRLVLDLEDFEGVKKEFSLRFSTQDTEKIYNNLRLYNNMVTKVKE